MRQLAGASFLRWGLAGLYLGLCFLPLLFLPSWVSLPLVLISLGMTLYSLLTAEAYWGRVEPIRPLTRWDLPDWDRFQADVAPAVERVGLRRPPVWAVLHSDEPNAMALTTPRGMVILSRALLQRFPQEEITAIVGHELAHLASRDALPAMFGSSFLNLLSVISYQCRIAGHGLGSFGGFFFLLLSLVMDLFLVVVGWLAEVLLAQRSRADEHDADLTGARLTSAGAMISALERLERTSSRWHQAPRWSVAWINQRLHASHPPMAARVAFLQERVERGELVG